MKHFVPFKTHWSPSRTAVVIMPPESEPEPGSVRAQEQSVCAFASEGTYFLRCSSLPLSYIWLRARELCASIARPVEPQTLLTSSRPIM